MAVILWVSSWVIMLQASLVYLRGMLGTWMHLMYGWSVCCSAMTNTVNQPIKDKNGIEVPRGQGNHVSVEFNVLYRVRIILPFATWFLDLYRQWHATTSQADEKWTEDLFKSKFGDKPLDNISLQDFAVAFGGAIRATLAIPPKDRTIGK